MSEAMLSLGGPGDRGSVGPVRPSTSSGTALNNVDCQCPVEAEFHQWRFIHSELLPLKVQDAYKLVFVQEKFMLDVLAGRKTFKYVAGDWARDPETGTSKRTLTYSMAFTYGKTSNVTETQVLSEKNRAGEAYVVLNEVCNEGVPLADNFSIMVHICLLRAAAPTDGPLADALPNCIDWCRYTCYSQIKYKKTVWGVIKGQLERSAYGGMEGVHKDVAAALKEHGLGSASTESSHNRATGQLQQARRKRRTKTMSTDLSLRLLKDSPGRGSPTNWSSVLVNVSLLLLIAALLLANLVLYSRVQALEAYASQASTSQASTSQAPPSTVSSGSQDGAASRLPLEDLCPDDTAKRINSLFGDRDGGVWVRVSRVLARQEELYFTELEEIRHHLDGASRALLEVDSEIGAVLKSLPKTLDLLVDVVTTELKQELSEQIKEKSGNESEDDIGGSPER